MNLSEDESAIYSAIGLAQTTWARLEYALCRVFCETISPLSHNPRKAISAENPAEAAFWSIVAFEGKLNMTDAAVNMRLSAYETQNSQLLSEWAKIDKRIGEKSRRRNQLAHGSIYRAIKPEGHGATTLFAPFYYKAMAGHHVTYVTGGLRVSLASKAPDELWNAQRIDTIRKGFEIGMTRLDRFHAALQAHNTTVYEREAAAQRFFETAVRPGQA